MGTHRTPAAALAAADRIRVAEQTMTPAAEHATHPAYAPAYDRAADTMRAMVREQTTATLRETMAEIAQGTVPARHARVIVAIISAHLVERVAAAQGDLDASVCRAAAMAHAQQGGITALAAYWANLDTLGEIA